MKKVLIITYYWPPSGGAGVQRWLKFAKYLTEFGWQPVILTVDEKFASYPVLDHSLDQEVKNNNIIVYKTKSKEILQLYVKLFGKSKLPQGGISFVEKSSFRSKIERFIRGNFFIPDPRNGWNKFAYPKAIELIEKYKIEVIITTSPPHSTQLIGLKLKRELGIKWVADLRDPWTSIFNYEDLLRISRVRKLDKILENKVIGNADRVITVGNSHKDEFEQLSGRKDISVITNGFDEDDFSQIIHERKNGNSLKIIYTGTMAESYEPYVLFDVIKELTENSNTAITLESFGNVSPIFKSYIKQKEMESLVTFHLPIPHIDCVEKMQNSDILLLIIPNSGKPRTIITGKLFEYLAARRPILCLGPKNGDAAKILNETNSGTVFERRDAAALKKWLLEMSQNNKDNKFTFQNIEKYSRRQLTKQLVEVLENI